MRVARDLDRNRDAPVRLFKANFEEYKGPRDPDGLGRGEYAPGDTSGVVVALRARNLDRIRSTHAVTTHPRRVVAFGLA